MKNPDTRSSAQYLENPGNSPNFIQLSVSVSDSSPALVDFTVRLLQYKYMAAVAELNGTCWSAGVIHEGLGGSGHEARM